MRCHRATAAGLLTVTVLLTGCTVGGPSEGTFVLPDAEVVECQQHQEVVPSSAYAGDEESDTVAMLKLLRYWQANGDKPYCDGEPPTEADLLWAETAERLRGGGVPATPSQQVSTVPAP